MSIYPRGSVWRRWDLHIHTPKSIIQNFGGDNKTAWDAFIAKIASLPSDIKVIGITDYLFCDGYEEILRRRSEISNIDLVIPNIEFRLNTFSGTAHNSKRHNFHVLFDPSVSINDIREQFLNCLASGYNIEDGTEWVQTPTRRSLSELGRQMKNAAPVENNIHKKSDFEAGFDNITYKREAILELLQKNCFKGKYVTAIGYSEWDQSRWDQSAAEKRTLINTANFSLTSLDDPEKIAANRNDLVENKLQSLVLHSSDAHETGRIGESLLWIKADPTFAGLKQVLNEPTSRVFIGKTPPNYKPDHAVISQINVPKSNGWFAEDFKLELNRDLIAIIGGRGSGKSALAEAIAYGAGSKDESEDAFLAKAAKHVHSITGTKIELVWANGSKTEFEVGTIFEDKGLVRHLPQGVVEELCSHKNSEKLQNQIENVIFQALDETAKLGASDFDELKSMVLKNFEYEKQERHGKILAINKKLGDLHLILKSLPEKEKHLEEKKRELGLLTRSLPELPAEDKRGQEELAALAELKKIFESKIIELQGILNTVSQIETRVKIFDSKIFEFQEELRPLLNSLEISDHPQFKVIFDRPGIQTVLDRKRHDIAEKLRILKEGERSEVSNLINISVERLSFPNLQALNRGIDEKQKITRAFETTKIKFQEQKKLILILENSIKALDSELGKIRTESTPETLRLENERMTIYCSYFDILNKEKSQIESLYKPLQDTLLAGSETDKKLVFEAQVQYDVDNHYRTGLEIIDRTRKGNFREINRLKHALSAMWDECLKSNFSRASLENETHKLIKSFQTFEENPILLEDQLREGYSVNTFYDWLFDPSNFSIVSSIKFDGTDLYMLSPGQKGIILLMLYLEIDRGDYRPLIIDQPEENLDNLSVYKDLIRYFRERKQYRQIIMVTHNPNLVVNTDSEQVVVANYDGKRVPRLQYTSGSLEDQAKQIPDVDLDNLDDGIIEQVCNILEGGERAFEHRKKAYQLSLKSKI